MIRRFVVAYFALALIIGIIAFAGAEIYLRLGHIAVAIMEMAP